MCKFISKPLKKLEQIQNKLLSPLGINTNIFSGGLKQTAGGMSDIDEAKEEAARELEEEKEKATEEAIQRRGGSRGRRSLLRSKSGGGAGFYNRFKL